jgi:hypothetical protein
MNNWHPWQLKKTKKIQILGAILELPAKQHCQFSYSPRKWAKWAKLAELFSWQLQKAPTI